MPVTTLARIVNLAPSTLYDLMRSDSMRSTKLHLIAKALGVNIDWLETGKGPRLVGEVRPGSDHRSQGRLQGEAKNIKETFTLYHPPITPLEAQIGRDWGQLQEPQRSVVAAQIQLLLKDQQRGKAKRAPDTITPKSESLE